ncbi:response regulator [Peribacillus huizhouensis]|uniref:histidine kinase n=1 Tax=Peribacillus huizhouensis TaxID=1501239 RepID=A0ABR6CUW0_9BACI|nr:response regulator [Peribacillus huizhouensis]MBA9028795.1 two-component system chemotaxis sensor kinase CheA [Peribacillus huizhouensis]
MSFKKKQFVVFGVIILFLAAMLMGIVFMVNSVKSNITEIVDDRYVKVSAAMEIRQLFSRSDREILYAVNDSITKEEARDSLEIIKNNQDEIKLKIAELSQIVNRSNGSQVIKQVEANYGSYSITETEIIYALEQGKSASDINTLMAQQRDKRLKVTSSIEEFKVYQEGLMNEALKEAYETYDAIIQFIIFSVGLVIIFITIAMIWMIRSTTKNLRSITSIMKKIDFNYLTDLPRIHVKTKDEIGDIAQAYNEMAASLEVSYQKEKDFTTEISEQNWIQTGLADIATMYQRIVNMENLGQRVISRLALLMGASLGVFYIKRGQGEEAKFVKLSSYADEEEVGRREFRLGEGLIGQCALEKESQIINQVPKDYKVISTGLGKVAPKSIFIAPVVFEDEVVAVIELASIETFTKLQQNFLMRVLETLGITINSVQGRVEIERLLLESQAQTEELQVQSEELQSQSEEMQAQSEELQSQAEELRMINEQLEERNREAEAKSRELQRAKLHLEDQAEQLKQSSKYKSEFLANMSHELRTPLNSILILSEMLSDQESTLSEEQQDFAKVIHSSGQDLLSLINDILDLSKVEVGKMDVVFDEMNVSELPELLTQNFEHIAQKKGLEFNVIKDGNVPDIFFTDQQRLQQILKNLLSNAFKFTETGSISVHIKCAEEQELSKWVHTDGADGWLEVSIADTGIGIPKSKQQLIFEAFQQGDGATMRKYGGTGLGLSICREFAKLLRGWLIVDSEEGEGSVFTLFLPSLPGGIEESAEVGSALPQVAASINEPVVESNHEPLIEELSLVETHKPNNLFQDKTVLVVDDDHRNIYALTNALKQEGMKILTAKTGLECLEIIKKEHTIDAILMDIMMPELDGYETMRRIRSTGQFNDMPIIALTAKAMKGDREKCLKAGASDYVSKPLKLNQLLSVLRVWLTNGTIRPS